MLSMAMTIVSAVGGYLVGTRAERKRFDRIKELAVSHRGLATHRGFSSSRR